jgi:hypothetical protein
MRLSDLKEAYYHGSPETQLLHRFSQQYQYITYIEDPEYRAEVIHKLSTLDAASAEYKMLDAELPKLITQLKIPKGIFLTTDYSVAHSYADDTRAFDYQNAVGGVLHVEVSDAPTISINARSARFRGISIDSVIAGLENAGFTKDEILAANSRILSGRKQNIISTDGLIGLVQLLDSRFTIIDVNNVIDNYNGHGPNTTVRIVLDASLVKIITRL